MSCLHLHLCQWCQPDALSTEALCSGVGCRRDFAIEGLGQPGAGGEGGCDRVFCPTGSYVVGLGVQRQGLDSSYLPWEPQLPPCPLAAPNPGQHCRSLWPGKLRSDVEQARTPGRATPASSKNYE